MGQGGFEQLLIVNLFKWHSQFNLHYFTTDGTGNTFCILQTTDIRMKIRLRFSQFTQYQYEHLQK